MIAKWYLIGAWLVLVALVVSMERRRGGESVTPAALTMLVNRESGIVLDVRPTAEYRAGHIVDSVNVPHSKVGDQVSELERYRSQPLVVVCKMGQQSGAVARQLKESGFERIYKLGGGITEWKNSQLPLTKS